jgi:eukaryotic-like serine/threonine-protein kinase
MKEHKPDRSDSAGETTGPQDLPTEALPGREPRPEATPSGSSPADWIAGYRVIRKLGEGGMGVVYEVEQQNPRRSVALKVIRGGAALDEQSARYFQREAESLARLKHPGIAAIFEIGCTDEGRRFFTMELVQGTRLDEYLRAHPLAEDEFRARIRERLAIFLKICQAINSAHQRGVIHRDLKPSNIMVLEGPESGSSPHRAEPLIKILDFGLARITDAETGEGSILTQSGQILGSIPYMSPEQAAGAAEAIDLRTDVYSLGVMLFEMLTGQPPYEVCGLPLFEALRVVREQAPRKPGGIRRFLRGDLETIVLKALEKEPGQRYQSVLALAEDIERYLDSQPILAHPPSARYQLRKLIARHKTAFAGALTLLVLLAAFGVTMSVMFQRQRQERLRADEARREAVLEADKARQVTEFLQKMLASVDPAKALGKEVTVREVLDEASRGAEAGLSSQPEVAAAIRSTIGQTYMALGLYEPAESHLRSALETRERLLGENDPDVASSLNDLGALFWKQGDYKEAEPLLRRALASHRNVPGGDLPDVALDLSNLGLLLKDQGNYAAAESLYRESLALRRQVFGEENVEVAGSLDNLAGLLQARGRFAEAEPFCRQALAIRRKLQGERHPEVALSLNNLANILQSEGKYPEAEGVMREALAMGKEILGPDHPSVSSTLGNLAMVLSYQGKYAEAESLYLQALGLCRKQLGEQHPAVASAMSNLAGLYQTEGRPAEAEPLYRRCLEMRKKLFGPEHPAVAMSLNNLAVVLQDQGRLGDAEPLFRQALALRRRLLGPTHPHVANSLLGLGSLLLRKGDARQAEPLLQECLAIRRGAKSQEAWPVAQAENALGACLTLERRYPEAESLLVVSTPVITASTVASPERKREALRRTIALYQAMNAPGKAEPYRAQLAQLERLQP